MRTEQRDSDEWKSSIRNENYPSSATEINQRFALFIKATANLTNQALLAAASNKIHMDILNFSD